MFGTTSAVSLLLYSLTTSLFRQIEGNNAVASIKVGRKVAEIC